MKQGDKQDLKQQGEELAAVKSSSDVRNSRKGSKRGKRGGGNRSRSNSENVGSQDLMEKWLMREPNLAIPAATLAYGRQLGSFMPKFTNMPFTETAGGALYVNENAVPGLATIYFAPTPGLTYEGNASAVNLAGRDQYTFLRYSNSRNAPYEAPDLILAELCIDSILMLINMGIKAYSVMKNNPYQNAYYPSAILKNMGFSYLDFSNDPQRLLGILNNAISQVNRIAIPGDLALTIRHSYLVSGLFLDAESPMAQTYQFVPSSYYMWMEGEGTLGNPNYADSVTIDDLAPDYNIAKGLTISQYAGAINKLLQPLLGSQSVMDNMSGDILKAYGTENLLIMNPVDTNNVLVPIRSTSILGMIENLTIIPHLSNLDVTQSTDFGTPSIIFQPKVDGLSVGDIWLPTSGYAATTNWYAICKACNDVLLNMHTEAPTVGANMTALSMTTRLANPKIKSTGTGTSMQTKLTADVVSCGSEIVTRIAVSEVAKNPPAISGQWPLYRTEENSVADVNVTYPVVSIKAGTTTLSVDPSAASKIHAAALYQQFDWHSSIDFIAVDYVTLKTQATGASGATTCPLAAWFGETRDIDTYTSLNLDVVRPIHNAMIRSLFAAPQIQAFTKSPYHRY